MLNETLRGLSYHETGCGLRVWNRYRWGFRRPKTRGEIRRNSHDELDGYLVRGRRRKLITYWDDVPIGDRSRSWKHTSRNRKQWMRENRVRLVEDRVVRNGVLTKIEYFLD